MASPTLDLVCCLFRVAGTNKSKPFKNLTNSTNSTNSTTTEGNYPSQQTLMLCGYIFFITLFLSAMSSIIGTGITLMPKRGTQRTRREAVADDRQRIILSWLAGSDLVACVGVVGLALFCLAELEDFMEKDRSQAESVADSLICLIFTVWVQFFYLATYFWSLFYALDIYLMLRGIKGKFLFRLYFCLSWFLSAVIMSLSLTMLYDKGDNVLKCVRHKETSGFFWGSYSALLFVFLAIPVLYLLSSKMISPMLKRGGIYTDRERKLKVQIQKKFLRIVIVFFICWLPNILNIIALAIQLKVKEDWSIFMVHSTPIWFLMALLNPMQAFFNALVYWGPAGCTKLQTSTAGSELIQEPDRNGLVGNTSGRSGEETPLLRSVNT